MTRLGITIEEVMHAADTILAQGENPTIEKVRRELGTGSNSTIAKYLNEWRTHRLITTANYFPHSQLPPDPVHAAVNQVWEKIKNESTLEIKAYQEKAQNEISIATTERNAAISERDQIQEELTQLKSIFNQISADKELLILDLKALQHEHHLLNEKYESLQREYHLHKEETIKQIALLQTINKNQQEDKEKTLTHIQETHDKIIHQFFDTQEKNRQQHIAEIDSHKVEQEKLAKLLENLSSEIQNKKIELQIAKSTIELISLERDAAKSESNQKDKLIENMNEINKSIKVILDKIEHFKLDQMKNEIFLKLSQVNNQFHHQETMLSSVCSSLKRFEKITE